MNGTGEREQSIGLRQVLIERLSDGELRDFCFELGIDYANLPGEGKAQKARELIAHLGRRNRIPELLTVGRQLRPDISWDGQKRLPPTVDLVNTEAPDNNSPTQKECVCQDYVPQP